MAVDVAANRDQLVAPRLDRPGESGKRGIEIKGGGRLPSPRGAGRPQRTSSIAMASTTARTRTFRRRVLIPPPPVPMCGPGSGTRPAAGGSTEPYRPAPAGAELGLTSRRGARHHIGTLTAFADRKEDRMPDPQSMDDPQPSKQDVPWAQRAFNSIWILAAAAMLYFFLSYVVWGLVDLARVPAGS